MSKPLLSTEQGQHVMAQAVMSDAKRQERRLNRSQRKQLTRHGESITYKATSFYAGNPAAFNDRDHGKARAVEFVLSSFILSFLISWLVKWLVSLLIQRLLAERHQVFQGRWT